MSKKRIGWLYALALIFEIILAIIFFAVFTSITQDGQDITQQGQQMIQQDQSNAPELVPADQQQLAQNQQAQAQTQLTAIITMLLLMGVAGIPGMIAWIGALINLSRGQQWAWFILMFFFGGIMLLIYLIGGPAVPKAGQTPVLQQKSAGGFQGNTPLAASPQMASPLVPQPPQQPSALDILQQRFARGEIDAATYQQMRDLLTR